MRCRRRKSPALISIKAWASPGFDRDLEAGEASRTGCVKFQPKINANDNIVAFRAPVAQAA